MLVRSKDEGEFWILPALSLLRFEQRPELGDLLQGWWAEFVRRFRTAQRAVHEDEDVRDRGVRAERLERPLDRVDLHLAYVAVVAAVARVVLRVECVVSIDADERRVAVPEYAVRRADRPLVRRGELARTVRFVDFLFLVLLAGNGAIDCSFHAHLVVAGYRDNWEAGA